MKYASRFQLTANFYKILAILQCWELTKLCLNIYKICTVYIHQYVLYPVKIACIASWEPEVLL